MEKKKNHAICVFCGSSFGLDPRYRDAARTVGAGIAKAGWSLVFGGGGNGLMGDVAKAAQAGGALVQGIIPAFLQALEPPVSEEEKLIVTPHIQERKALMLRMADAFLVLPGGVGTLDEFFEVCTEAQLGVHKKPIVVVNVDGYYDTLDSLLRAIVERGFARHMIFDLYHLAEGPEAALSYLRQRLDQSAQKDKETDHSQGP
ncbi:MAG TPA: TIGR00730 family Rossman fold protein [Rhizomicrobium sp.]|nr:TIGR00730 family Rossman fold protein [Rhizomicrobium sp.]